MILVAPDKYKHTLTAAQAAGIIADSLRDIDDVIVAPMADGGEGTADILVGGLHGWERVGQAWFHPGDRVAVLDSSSYIGPGCFADSDDDILTRSSRPLGEAVRILVDTYHATKVVIGIGGTYTCDGGEGFLKALGAMTDGDVDLAPLLRYKDIIVGLSDVQVPLLPSSLDTGHSSLDTGHSSLVSAPSSLDTGHSSLDTGHSSLDTALSSLDSGLWSLDSAPSSLTFAPQKGATPDQLPQLYSRLDALRRRLGTAPSPYDGAGGGLGYAIASVIGAKTMPGIEAVLARYNLPWQDITLIVTGEGCVDAQTSLGKVVGALTAEGERRHIPVIIFGGHVDTPTNHSTPVSGHSSLDSGLSSLDSGHSSLVPGLTIATDTYYPHLPLTPRTAAIRLRRAAEDALMHREK